MSLAGQWGRGRMQDLLTLVLAGGKGDRLWPLTRHRAKPVVPFWGRRLIDFTLGNCARSRIRDVLVLTQYLDKTVEHHVARTWGERFNWIGTLSSSSIHRDYRGTADAVRVALRLSPGARRILILAGDHVYGMNYRRLVELHDATHADGTLSAIQAGRSDARSLGVLSVGAGGRILEFREKPDDPPDSCLASMGIYVFDAVALGSYLADHPDAQDFGHDVIPGMLAEDRCLIARPFGSVPDEVFWRDIADVDTYHAACLEMLDGALRFEPHRPAELEDVVVVGRAEHSVLGSGVRVEHHADVRDSVLLDGVVVGPSARLRRVVAEEGVRVPAGAEIGFCRTQDRARGHVTAEGVVVLTRGVRRRVPARV